MVMQLIRRVRQGWLMLFGNVCLLACANDPNTLGISNSAFTSDYGVVVVDTVTVDVSTVLLDSFPTSNTGSVLVGGYIDNKLGRMQAEGYLQLGVGNTWTPPADATFDSLVLIAHYGDYVYGDTLAPCTLEVWRLSQPFQTWALPQFWINEGQYSSLYAANSKFSSSAMRYYDTPLGSRTIQLRPGSTDSVMVRLDNALGQQWLAMAKDQSPDITEENRFQEYFKGLCLRTTGSENSVVGLTTEDLKIRLYYRTLSGERHIQANHDFTFVSGMYSYTRFLSDRSGTPLAGLTPENKAISAARTDDMAFIQAGTGLVMKLSFPYITQMIGFSDVLLVNQAQLIIEPVKDSFSDAFPLPSTLALYHTDQSNLPQLRVYANYNTSSYQTATAGFDKEFNRASGFTFTLTQYVQELVSTDGNRDKALLVMPAPDQLNTSVNRVYLGASGDYRVRLKIWYTQSK